MKLYVAIALLIFSTIVNSESVWCEKFNIFCQTSKEKAQILANCNMLSNQIYREALTESLADPSIWQLGGYKSAQDYAEKRKQGMLFSCLKNN